MHQLMKWNELKKYLYHHAYWYHYYNYFNNYPPRKLNLSGGVDRDNAAPSLITAVIALSLGLSVLIVSNSNDFEPIIEWLLGILAIACAYNALWMLALYCTGTSSPNLGFYSIVYLLRNRKIYGPYWFLGLIFAVYFFILLGFLIGGILPHLIKR